jgi:hypothetical protein
MTDQNHPIANELLSQRYGILSILSSQQNLTPLQQQAMKLIFMTNYHLEAMLGIELPTVPEIYTEVQQIEELKTLFDKN